MIVLRDAAVTGALVQTRAHTAGHVSNVDAGNIGQRCVLPLSGQHHNDTITHTDWLLQLLGGLLGLLTQPTLSDRSTGMEYAGNDTCTRK
jgi:hypothetical protein